MIGTVYDSIGKFLSYLNRQKWNWLLGLTIAALVVVCSFFSSLFLYAIVNQIVMPRIHTETTLVFGPPERGRAVRFANASMNALLSGRTVYSLDLHLHWPENEMNMAGEKTVGLIMKNERSDILFNQRRSVLLRYKSWLRLVFEKVIWSLPLALDWVDESQTTVVNLASSWLHDGSLKFALVELDASAQIYGAKMTARATLNGYKYYWYHWRITVFIFFVSILWSIQLTICALLGVILLAKLGAFSDDEFQEARIKALPVVVEEPREEMEFVPFSGEISAESEIENNDNETNDEEEIMTDSLIPAISAKSSTLKQRKSNVLK